MIEEATVGSTRRKLKKIGSCAARFEPNLNSLPMGNWTTLYRLACLKPDQYQRVVESEKLKPDMEAKTIDDVIGEKTPTKGTANRDLTIDMKDSAAAKMIELYEEIEDLHSDYEFQINPGKRVQDAIKEQDAKKEKTE